MMEFSNLDHQHQQDLLGGSSPLPSPPFQLLGASHDWNHSLILNGGGLNPNVNGVLSGSRDIRLSNDIPSPTLNMTHMIQDLGFHCAGTAESYINHSSVHQANMDRTKEELSSDPFNSPSTSCVKNEQELDQRMLMKAFLSRQTNGIQPQGRDLPIDIVAPSFASFGRTAARGRGNYSVVLPTTDISSPNPEPMYSVSLGMDLQALDLLASARYCRTISGPSFNNVALLREGIPFGLGHLQNQVQEASYGHYKVQIPTLVSGVTETKRSNSLSEHEASQPVPKKHRFETRSPCAPFKVRKEKLGDRIAALQQLVAPFGKTDTASVLMEAIGYIKFLQDQVETLSVPYMSSFNNKKMRASEGASSEDAYEPKPDLRSRGLCLVPLSCTSYFTNENGGVWSPPNFL